jgi:thiamine pyrophosphate-dependent acetolactate synthase large subunit-like protein
VGIAASRAEGEMRRFVEETGIPYLAMAMGIIPDDHNQAAAAASCRRRSPSKPATSASRRSSNTSLACVLIDHVP